MRFSFISRKETRNEQDTLLPFDEWEAADTRTWSGALDGSWELRVIPESLDESALYVTFEVTDTQNNRYSSRLRKVKQGADALPDPSEAADDPHPASAMTIAKADRNAKIFFMSYPFLVRVLRAI